MILKAISKLCKKRKRIALYTDRRDDCQWIGDGSSLYPLYGMPELDEETVFAVLDIPEDKREGYVVTWEPWPQNINAGDEAAERPLLSSPCGIVWKKMALMPARTSLGLRFYNPEYLKPLADADSFELYERETPDGQIYLAVKTGFLLRAILLPMLPEPEAIAEHLKQLHAELEATIGYRAYLENGKDAEAYACEVRPLTDEEDEEDVGERIATSPSAPRNDRTEADG